MITLALISFTCLAWFYARHIELRAIAKHDLLVAAYKARLDAFSPTWRAGDSHD